MSGGAGRWEQEDAHCSAESSFGWLVGSFCQVRRMDEGEDSNAGGKGDFY